MQTLDLLSQVLFVALMAMLLYVLYKRFVRMLSRDRIVGSYAHVVSCQWHNDGRLVVVIESGEPGTCILKWEGGQTEFECHKGRHEATIDAGPPQGGNVEFVFANQVIRRKVA